MFGFIKKLFNMKKEELEQQLADAIAVAQRLGNENRELREKNEVLINENTQLRNDFDAAVERVRYLAEQIRMKEAQQVASERFNDNDRNY